MVSYELYTVRQVQAARTQKSLQTYMTRPQKVTFGEIWGALAVHMACNPHFASRPVAEHVLNTHRTSFPDRMGP